MSPEQMQMMMNSVKDMDPAIMQRMMGQNVSAADMARMQQEVGSMDPSTLASRAEQASNMLSAQQKYIFDVS